MIRFATGFVSLVFALNLYGGRLDVEPQKGRTVAAINWTDENGRTRHFSEFAGYPVVLLPIYTRCPGACIQNVDRLKQAFEDSSSDPRRFRVLLFSFDPTETPASLAQYRQREKIPLGWSIGSASQTEIDALLDSIGIQVGKAGKEFIHPNVLLFIDPDLRIAKWIYGTEYSGGDIDRAIGVAAGESDWIAQHAQLIYALLLFAGSILCVALCYHCGQINRRRAGDLPPKLTLSGSETAVPTRQ